MTPNATATSAAPECPREKLAPATMPRRSALRLLLGGSVVASLASVFYPVMRYLVPPADANLGANDALAATVGELKPNTAKTFRFGSRPALLVRTQEGEYKAMSAVCTHLGCTVQYKADAQQIWCACHNGFYDLNGRNVSGPPPRPLDSYFVHVRGQEIYVSRNQGA